MVGPALDAPPVYSRLFAYFPSFMHRVLWGKGGKHSLLWIGGIVEGINSLISSLSFKEAASKLRL